MNGRKIGEHTAPAASQQPASSPTAQIVTGGLLLCAALSAPWCLPVAAQSTSQNPSELWTTRDSQFSANSVREHAGPEATIDLNRSYTLSELIDFAERQSPETRAAWQRARVQAASVGIARSALFPTLTGLVLSQTTRSGILFNSEFVRQTEGIGEVALKLDYTVFDFGARQDALTAAHDTLFATNFAFNDTHLAIIYRVTDAYYRLLTALGQVDAAKANLVNATTVQQNADARLAQGLATLPDALEARAAEAQAAYDLASVEGAQQIALADLATTLGLPASDAITVQPLEQLAPAVALEDTAQQAIESSLAQRPDLMEQVARIRAADAQIREARSEYVPEITFSGVWGRLRGFGEQDQLPSIYAATGVWNAQLNLSWTLFDGGKRHSDLAHAVAEKKNAQAELAGDIDRAQDQVWTAYTNMRTAIAQQNAARQLLEASSSSYNAALESYKYGVRSTIDVVAAQRALAQARSADVTARANVYRQTATLAFRTGDLLRKPVPVPATLPPAPTAPAPGAAPGTPPAAVDMPQGGTQPQGAIKNFVDGTNTPADTAGESRKGWVR